MATRQTLKKPDSRYHHGDLRSALVVTAWSVIERKGIEAFSLRVVARLRAGGAAGWHRRAERAASFLNSARQAALGWRVGPLARWSVFAPAYGIADEDVGHGKLQKRRSE